MTAKSRAKRIIRELMGLGNFDEFRDHREKDGINDSAVAIIEREVELDRADARPQGGS